MDKLEGSWSRLTYLGFELESSTLEIWLLQAKLRELQQLISTWVGCKSCPQRELELLVGQLEHASQVAPGKIVMQRLFELLAEIQQVHHHIHPIHHSVRPLWWATFLDT